MGGLDLNALIDGIAERVAEKVAARAQDAGAPVSPGC